MNFLVALQNALGAIFAFIPLFLLFLLILIVGLIVAKLIAKGLEKLLEKVGFDRLVERGGIKRALAKSKLDASDIIAKIVYYTLVLFVLQFAFGVFGPNPVSDLLEGIIAFLPKIIVAIIIVIIAAAIAAGAKTLIQNTLSGLSYGRVLANIAAIFILFLGITAALNQVEVATTVTTPILIAVLAIIAGVIIVGVGGGLIKPMQARWEGMLNKAEEEAPKIKREAQDAPPAKEQLKDAARRVTAPDNAADRERTAVMPPASAPAAAPAPPTVPPTAQGAPAAPPVPPTTPGAVPPPPTRRSDQI
ncbi:mechanosensitive ion channel family protein [Microbacterium aureliae]